MAPSPQSIGREIKRLLAIDQQRSDQQGKFPSAWNALPRTRAEALSRESIYFFTAKLCSAGHLERRFTSSGACYGCVRARQIVKDRLVKENRANTILQSKPQKKCPWCGKLFVLTPEMRSDKVFCSDKCAMRSSQHAYVLRDPERRRRQSSQHAMTKYNNMTLDQRRERARQSSRQMGDSRRAKHTIRTRINGAVRTALGGGIVRGWTLKDIGFDVDKYMRHMESLWEPGMSWENYGKGPGKWVRDEIVPMCAFDMRDKEQAKRCLDLKNLRPMWWEANLKKAAQDRRLSIRESFPKDE